MASIPSPIRKWIEQFTSDKGFFQSSSDVDHDATSNRTHSGDDLSPESIEVGSFGNTATESIQEDAIIWSNGYAPNFAGGN